MTGKEDKQGNPDESQSAGIFVGEGMSLVLSNLSFTLHDDGRIEASRPIVHLRLDQTPVWLRIAVGHVVDADRAHARVMDAHRAGDDQAKSRHLTETYVSGMQAIVAAATAVDAFYATVKSYMVLDDELVAAWRRNRTARYRQVTEVLRQGFSLRPRAAVTLRRFFRHSASRRDQAVHPGPEAQEAVLHPDLGVGVEWRFVAFGRDRALTATQSVLRIVTQLTSEPNRLENKPLGEYCVQLAKALPPIVADWEQSFGPIHE